MDAALFITEDSVIEYAREGRAFIFPTRRVLYAGPLKLPYLSDEVHKVECYLDDSYHLPERRYKIEFVPDDERYEKHTLYISDLASLVRQGVITIRD